MIHLQIDQKTKKQDSYEVTSGVILIFLTSASASSVLSTVQLCGKKDTVNRQSLNEDHLKTVRETKYVFFFSQ